MKLNRIEIIAFSLVLGLLPLTSTTQAQPKPLTIALTATYQLADTTSADGNTTTSTTKTEKFTSASIMNLVATNMGFSDKGYALICDPFNSYDIGATNKATGDFEDASGANIFTVDNSGTQVNVGTANSATGKESETYTTYVVITFDDGNGNSFTVDGLAKSTLSQPAATATQVNNGITPNETISFSVTVSGFGTIVDKAGNTDTALFTGTFSGGGSGQGGS